MVESFLQHKFLVVSDGNLCVFKSLIQRHLPYQVPLKSHNFLTFIWHFLLKRLCIEVPLFCNFGFSEVYGFFHGFLGLVLDSAQGPRTWSYRCVLTINKRFAILNKKFEKLIVGHLIDFVQITKFVDLSVNQVVLNSLSRDATVSIFE